MPLIFLLAASSFSKPIPSAASQLDFGMAQVGNGRVFRGKIEPAIPFLSGDAALVPYKGARRATAQEVHVAAFFNRRIESGS